MLTYSYVVQQDTYKHILLNYHTLTIINVDEKTIVEPTQTIQNLGKKSAHFEKESWENIVGLPAENEWAMRKGNHEREMREKGSLKLFFENRAQ